LAQIFDDIAQRHAIVCDFVQDDGFEFVQNRLAMRADSARLVRRAVPLSLRVRIWLSLFKVRQRLLEDCLYLGLRGLAHFLDETQIGERPFVVRFQLQRAFQFRLGLVEFAQFDENARVVDLRQGGLLRWGRWRGLRGRRVRENVPGVVRHRHVARFQSLDRIRDEKADGIDRTGVERRVSAAFEENLGVVPYQVANRMSNHDFRRLDAIHLRDLSRQFSLQTRHEIRLLNEVGDLNGQPCRGRVCSPAFRRSGPRKRGITSGSFC